MEGDIAEFTFGRLYEYSQSLPDESKYIDIIMSQEVKNDVDSIENKDINYENEDASIPQIEELREQIEHYKVEMNKMISSLEKRVNKLEKRINELEKEKVNKNNETDEKHSDPINSLLDVKEYIGEIKKKPNKAWTEREFNILLRAQRLRLADPFPFYASKIT